MEIQGQRKSAMSQINVTPFVDVMLVLLIIFMVTAPMMQNGVNVKLPEVDNAASVSTNDDTVTVSINKAGEIYLGKTQITDLSKLGAVVNQVLASKKHRAVHLEADRKVDYGTVAKVVAALQAAGVTELGLVTEMDQAN